MILDALKYCAGFVQASAAPQKLDVPDEYNRRYVVNGKVETVAVPKSPRSHNALSLDEVVALANRFAKAEGCTPVVWYNDSEVVLVIDDAGHRAECARLALEYTDVFKRVAGLSQWMDQKAFVRLLRIDLAGTIEPVVLLTTVRKAKFDNGVVVTGQVMRQKESMGKEIRSEVKADGGEIPEEVVLKVPVLKTFGEWFEYPVRCSVEVEPSMGTFRLMPLPDEITRAKHRLLNSIQERLQGGARRGGPVLPRVALTETAPADRRIRPNPYRFTPPVRRGHFFIGDVR